MLEDNNFWERVETIMAEVAIIKLAVRWEECEHWSSTNGETCFPHKVNQAPLAYTISQKKTSWNNKTTWGLPLHSLMGKDPTERRELLWPSPILLWPFSCCPPRIPSLFWYLISTPNSNPAPPASDRSKTWLYLDYSSTFFFLQKTFPLLCLRHEGFVFSLSNPQSSLLLHLWRLGWKSWNSSHFVTGHIGHQISVPYGAGRRSVMEHCGFPSSARQTSLPAVLALCIYRLISKDGTGSWP